jgi:hypothetical protein
LIMLTGQALVFMLILQTVLAIEGYVSETAIELDRITTLSSMEITSENVMLDCCLRLHTWAMENPEITADLILPLAKEWEGGMEECLSEWSCKLSLEDLIIEPLANQTVDPFQTGFLGWKGDECIFISANLIVSLEAGDLLIKTEYSIRIAS